MWFLTPAVHVMYGGGTPDACFASEPLAVLFAVAAITDLCAS